MALPPGKHAVTSEDVARYEGLVLATATRYEGLMDDDFDDVAQVLRTKIWQALGTFDPRRSNQPEEKYVFSCLRNRVKDMLKQQYRLNERRQGQQIFIEGLTEHDDERTSDGPFYARYLSVEADVTYAEVEDEEVALPSTLTALEVEVVGLLLEHESKTEIARRLGLSRQRIRTVTMSIQEKLADWKPTDSSLVQGLVDALEHDVGVAG